MSLQFTGSTPEGGRVYEFIYPGQWWIYFQLITSTFKRVFSIEIKLIRDEEEEILLNWRYIRRELFPCNSGNVYGWKQSRRDPAFGFPADYYAFPSPIGSSIDVGGAIDNPYRVATSYGPFWAGHYLVVDNTEQYYGNSTPSGVDLPAIQALTPAQRIAEASTTNMGTENPESIHQYVEMIPGDILRFTVRQFRCNPAILDSANGLLTDDIPLDGGPADDEEELTLSTLSYKFLATAIFL